MDDDDFMGDLPFNLTPEQGHVVNEAISFASSCEGDAFRTTNPLISILQWWERNIPDDQKLRGSREETLAEACRQFMLAHKDSGDRTA